MNALSFDRPKLRLRRPLMGALIVSFNHPGYALTLPIEHKDPQEEL